MHSKPDIDLTNIKLKGVNLCCTHSEGPIDCIYEKLQAFRCICWNKLGSNCNKNFVLLHNLIMRGKKNAISTLTSIHSLISSR